ncbi:hypothetical protein D3C76_1224970 [compost metagenome]
MSQRQAGVAHPHREQIAHDAGLSADHRPVAKWQAEQHRQHDPAVSPGRKQPEERECHHQQADHADVVDRLEADAIRQRPPEQNREKLHQHRQGHGADNFPSADANVFGVDHREGKEDVRCAVLRQTQGNGLQQRFRVFADNHQQRDFLVLVFGFGLGKGLALTDVFADVNAD